MDKPKQFVKSEHILSAIQWTGYNVDAVKKFLECIADVELKEEGHLIISPFRTDKALNHHIFDFSIWIFYDRSEDRIFIVRDDLEMQGEFQEVRLPLWGEKE